MSQVLPPEISWIHPSLYVGPSTIDGQGVFTSAALPQGTKVIVWGGVLFTHAEIVAGGAQQHTNVGIDEETYLASPEGAALGVDDYMNHSCGPNIGMADPITLVTRVDVQAGDELTADYAIWLNDEAYVMKKPCNCGSGQCRITIRGSDWRQPQVQALNRGFFSPFIAKRIFAVAEGRT